jgi:hypothetical protein
VHSIGDIFGLVCSLKNDFLLDCKAQGLIHESPRFNS